MHQEQGQSEDTQSEQVECVSQLQSMMLVLTNSRAAWCEVTARFMVT